MADRKLRAVTDDEKAPKAEPKTIAEAAEAGDYRATLAKLRDRLAVTLDDPNTPARDLASTSRRFLEVCRELAALDERAEQEAVEDGQAVADSPWEAV